MSKSLKRCALCSKKLNLIEQTLTCKCNNNYCPDHRHAEDHNCNFDFHSNESKKLEKTLMDGKAVATNYEQI